MKYKMIPRLTGILFLTMLVHGLHAQFGIGTLSPQARLHVVDSSVIFSAPGGIPYPAAAVPALATGRYFYWHPGRAAGRLGYFSNTSLSSTNLGRASFAVGYNTIASGENAAAFGMLSRASGAAAMAIGRSTTASGDNATALGSITEATGYYTTAMGFGSKAIGDASIAMGINAQAGGEGATAIGGGTNASGIHATAIGRSTRASGPAAVAMGYDTEASGDTATAMGSGSKATGHFSVAMGRGIRALGANSIAIGNRTGYTGLVEILGISMGDRSGATGEGAIAMGYGTFGMGNGAVAMGRGESFSHVSLPHSADPYGVAMGRRTMAGSFGTAMGYHTRTWTYGTAMGSSTNADANGVAMGAGTRSGPSGVAMGYRNSLPNISPPMYSIAMGRFNFLGGAIFTIGNGTDNENRSNALTLSSRGKLTISGSLTQNSDARLKTNILPLSLALAKVLALNGYHYNWNNRPSNTVHTGLLAQEVQEQMPELVREDAQGNLSVNYTGMVPYLIESIKTQHKEFEAEQKTVEQLRKEMEVLKAKLR